MLQHPNPLSIHSLTTQMLTPPQPSFPPMHSPIRTSTPQLLHPFPIWPRLPAVLPCTSSCPHLGHRASPTYPLCLVATPFPHLSCSILPLLLPSLPITPIHIPRPTLYNFISSPVIPRPLQRLVASSPSVSSEGGFCFLRTRLLLKQPLIHSPLPTSLRVAVMNVAYLPYRHPEHHGSTRDCDQVHRRLHPTW
jgi:hypothetical protein